MQNQSKYTSWWVPIKNSIYTRTVSSQFLLSDLLNWFKLQFMKPLGQSNMDHTLLILPRPDRKELNCTKAKKQLRVSCPNVLSPLGIVLLLNEARIMCKMSSLVLSKNLSAEKLTQSNFAKLLLWDAKIDQNTNFAKLPSAKWPFFGITVNIIIQKLTSKN